MFVDELAPIFKELTAYPVAFFGGFFSGILRLNLADDPVKSWLDKQVGAPAHTTEIPKNNNGNSSGPQSITID